MQKFNATIKGATANVAKNVATVTLSFPYEGDGREVLDALAFYVGKMPVGVVVSPQQLSMDEVLNKQAEKERA